jgi:hypothetical protein
MRGHPARMEYSAMDDQPTEAPWYSDVADIIYAVNGRPGQTTVATLGRGADPVLLAAAPDLLWALENSMECLESEYAKTAPGARQLAVLDARNGADVAITRATKAGYPDAATRVRAWMVNPDLPKSERKANARLLDAAADLLAAVQKAYAALAGHVDNPEVVGALQRAIVRATGD